MGTDDLLIYIARVILEGKTWRYSVVAKSKKSLEHPNIEIFSTEIILTEENAKNELSAKHKAEQILSRNPANVENYHNDGMDDDFYDEEDGDYDDDYYDEDSFLDEDMPY